MNQLKDYLQSHLKNYIQFDRTKCIIGIVLAVLTCILFALSGDWGTVCLCAVLFPAFGSVKFSLPKTWMSYLMFAIWAGVAVWFVKIAPAYTMDLVHNTWETDEILFLNYLCIFITLATVFTITLKPKLAVTLGSFLLLLLAVINGFVYPFRGRELGYMDLFAIQTAINVAGQYHVKFTLNILYVIVRWVAILFIGYSLPELPRLPRLIPRVIGAFTVVVMCLSLNPLTSNVPIKTWASEGTRLNGFYINVYMTVRDASMEKPPKYSPTTVEQLAGQYLATEAVKDPSELPDVVVIMNESYADLRMFGGLNTNRDVTPFIDSLTENTIRGYALTSVYGGNTANSEFEFLTGHSMAFFPDSSVPYQQYINKQTHSLVNVMEGYGYQTVGTHPYWESGWSRDIIYPYLGFDTITFADDYANNYPVRHYTSDRDMFEYVLEHLNNNDPHKPMFLFGVTMQNHGGYDYEGEDFTQHIQLQGYEKEYPLATQYLSLLHETDMAVEYLVNELEKREKPTILLVFGDHLPQLDQNFYDDIYGKKIETPLEKQQYYTVPFFIWANYDIPEKTIPYSSFNYLPVHLLENAGLPLSPYLRFLKSTEEIIPALNYRGFYSKEKNALITYSEASPKEQEALNQYQALVYNHLFDHKNKNTIFFP